ncbi:hypothetical protein, partial [Streptomyces alkaliterrae]|uniref:hypothetical protein n=1 Tax=Streptomyces alkaliterrae TaxID=2213162 RepID=UPI001E59DE99
MRLSQRAISQPFDRSNDASTFRPAQVPVTRAVCGPPCICVHMVSADTGSHGLRTPRVARSTAAPPAAVGCDSGRAMVRVTRVSDSVEDCGSGVGHAYWYYRA